MLWGRELTVNIVYDCYEGEKILPTQKVAYEKFIKKAEKLMDESLSKVKEYCIQTNSEEIQEDEISNIFRYVKPKEIFIKRTHNGDRMVAMVCAYKFNPENGLAILFKNEMFYKLGSDNIL